MMNILSTILIQTKADLPRLQKEKPLAELKAQAREMPAPRGFAAAIRAGRSVEESRHPKGAPSLIAEVKKASPSAGVIREDFQPAALAAGYEMWGAKAISCLTNEKFFQGSLDYLRAVRAAVSVPVLRKEFMVDPYQVWEARAAGADAILLIAGFVSWPEQFRLRDAAHDAGMDVLLEVHSREEMEVAIELKPDVLGINNRNLRTKDLKTNLDVTRELHKMVPSRWTLISESGIRTSDDVMELGLLGIDGMLVGEHLMREPDPGQAIRDVLGIQPPEAKDAPADSQA